MKMFSSNRKLRLAGMFIICLALCIMLQSGAAAAKRTEFKITIIAASKSSGGIDSKLNHLKKNLSQLSQYSKFRYVSAMSFTLAPNDQRGFDISGGFRGSIRLKSIKNKRAAFNFKLSSRSKGPVDINYSISIGGVTMIVGPSVHSETYIIVIQAIK